MKNLPISADAQKSIKAFFHVHAEVIEEGLDAQKSIKAFLY